MIRGNVRTLLLIFSLVLVSPTLQASPKKLQGNQSYESCGLITGEYLTVLQLISRGFDPDKLKKSLPEISEKAQARVDILANMVRADGLTETYSTINSEYASCARKVFRTMGIPSQGSRESHFYECAGENKVRYEIAIAALIGATKGEVIRQLEPRHKPSAQSIFASVESGEELDMFDNLASELKRCLAALP